MVKVIYVAGSGRSGSTLLTRLLGEVRGVANIGEALEWFLNLRRQNKSRPCACGKTVKQCPLWGDIRPFSGNSKQFASYFLRFRFLPFLPLFSLFPSFKSKKILLNQEITDFYTQISEKTGCEVVVDSSKHPGYLHLLVENHEIDLFLIHLLRDPRAVAASWLRPKGDLEAHTTIESAAWWIMYNCFTDRMKPLPPKYLLLKYESFVQNPKVVMRKIIKWIGYQEPDALNLPFDEQGKAILSLQHIVGGNPDRETYGKIKIESRTWKLSKGDWILATAITLPGLLRYKYPLIYTNGFDRDG